jgi:hypothetical protein
MHGSPSKLKDRTFRVTFRVPAIEQTSKTKTSKPVRWYRNPVTLAREWQGKLTAGDCSSPATLARRLGVSRAQATQVLQLLKLTPKVLEILIDLGDPLPSPVVTERWLRALTRLAAEEQVQRIQMLLANQCTSAQDWLKTVYVATEGTLRQAAIGCCTSSQD